LEVRPGAAEVSAAKIVVAAAAAMVPARGELHAQGVKALRSGSDACTKITL
jgi:hypothetical protein